MEVLYLILQKLGDTPEGRVAMEFGTILMFGFLWRVIHSYRKESRDGRGALHERINEQQEKSSEHERKVAEDLGEMKGFMQILIGDRTK